MNYKIYYFRSLCLFTLTVYSAEPVEKKVMVVQKAAYSKGYTYVKHLIDGSDCYMMRLSPDESMVMSGGYNYRDKNHLVRFHNADNGADIVDPKTQQPLVGIAKSTIYDAVWSPNSATCIWSHQGGTSYVPNIQAARPPVHVSNSYLHESTCYYTLTGVYEDIPRNMIWVSHNGIFDAEKTLNFQIHKNDFSDERCFPEQSCFLNKGKLLCLYAPTAQSVVTFDIAQVAEGKYVAKSRFMNATAADLSGEIPVFGSNDGQVTIINPDTGGALTTMQAFANKAISAVTLSPTHVAAISDHTIRILSRLRGTKISEYIHREPGMPRMLRFSPTGEGLAYAANETISILDGVTAKPLQVLRLDGAPHTMVFVYKGLFAGTSNSITKFVPQDQKDQKQEK